MPEVTETIRLRDSGVPAFMDMYSKGNHTLYSGSFEQYGRLLEAEKTVDIFLFDPPGLDANSTPYEVSSFMKDVASMIDRAGKPDCVVIMPFRDRKGHPFLKSTICMSTMMGLGWQLFRQIIWMTGEADFHRSRSAYAPIAIFRRGDKPSHSHSPIKYKDVIRQRDTNDSGAVWALPVPLVKELIQLFANFGDVVCDPFAGSGSVMKACNELGLKSVSVELDKKRFEDLTDLAMSFKEARGTAQK
jgi:hypothetical protein